MILILLQDLHNGPATNLDARHEYTFTVRNTGNVTLRAVQVSDPRVSGLDPLVVDELAPGESVVISADPYVVTAEDVAHGSVDNTATVHGDAPNGDGVSAEDTSSIETAEEATGGSGSGTNGGLPETGSLLSVAGLGLALMLCAVGGLAVASRGRGRHLA